MLAFLTSPSGPTAGVPFSVTVQARDNSGNVVTCFTGNVTISLGTNPGGATLSGTTTAAATAGVATFSNLSINKSAAGYTLQAASAGVSSGTSTAFVISPAPATSLAVTTQPTNTTAGSNIAPGIAVTVRDQFANTATNFAGTVAIAITPATGAAGATLAGTASVATALGVATFSGLSIDKAATGYTLTATATGLVPATTTTFNIVPGATAKLVFTAQPPASAAAGAPMTPALVVTGQDSKDNTTPAFVGAVTVAITGGTGTAGATLSGTKTVTAVGGVATFSTLSLDKPGIGYTLTATATGVAPAVSNGFNVVIGPLSQLIFTQQPNNATAGAAIAPAIVVTGQDAAGNTVTGFTGNVTMSIGTNPVSGTLSGTLTVAATSGVATFSNLSIDKAATGYTLTAAAGAVNKASTAFSIIAGAATQLVFSVQPVNTAAGATVAPAVVVTAQDGFNNSATSFGNAVTVAITGGTGKAGATLSGTLTRTATSGVATFADLSIDSVATGYTLSATAAGLVGAFASASFNISLRHQLL